MPLAPDSTLHATYRIAQVADGRPDEPVYRASTSDGRRVLIAALPNANAAERDEMRVLAQQLAALAPTDGLLPLRDHFAEGDAYYLVCDDPGGPDLDRYVRDRGGPLPEALVLAQMGRLLRALEALHGAKAPLFVGDLRSSDVWADQRGDLALAPFAALRPLGAQDAGYRAPELAQPDSEPNGSADMYSFGALFYQLLTGWLPPQATQRTAGRPLEAPRALNARISPLAEQAVLRSLELKPTNRYQVPREMRQALDAVQLMAGRSLGLEGGPVPGAPPPPQPATLAPANMPPGVAFPPPPQIVPAPVEAQPGGAQPPPSGYNQPWAQQPFPAAPRRGNGCLIATAVLLGLVVLLLAIALAVVLLRPSLLGSAHAPTVAATALPAATASSVTTDATPAASAAATSVPEATQLPANTAAISLASAKFLTETQVFTESVVGPVLFAPDGKTLAVSDGAVITLRDSSALDTTRAVLRGHTGDLNALAFSPDGALLASGAIDDQAIRLWDAQTGKLARTLAGHDGWIRSLTFAHDGALLASASTDKTIRLWNPADGTLVRTLTGHTDFVTRVAFAPDGKTLASTSRDGTVRLWDVATGQQRPEFSFTTPPQSANAPEGYADKPFWMTGLAFSPDGALLAAGSTDGLVRVWELPAGTLVQTLTGHQGWVMPNMLTFTPDSKTVVSGSRDGTVRLWDPRTGAERGSLHTPRLLTGIPEFTALDVSPDGATLATSSDESGLIVLWSIQSGEATASLALGQGATQSLDYSADGHLLVSSGVNGVLQIFDVASGERGTLPIVAPVHQALAFVGATKLALVTSRATVVLLDLTKQGTLTQLEGLSSPAFCVTASSDGRLIAAGSSDGTVVVWDAATLKVTHTLKAQNANVGTLAFSPDGALLAAGTVADNADVTLFDTHAGSVTQTLSGHTDTILSIAFQPNGLTVATTSVDGTLRLWDRAGGKQLASLDAQPGEGYYNAVAFSPDGSLLVTGSLGGTISLRSPINGEPVDMIAVSPISSSNVGVLALQFRRDGEQLVAGGRDGSVRLFGLKK